MPISKIPVGAIQSGTIGTSQIADNAVTTAKILNDNVTSAKIPNDAIGSTEIASSAVTRDELQSAAVNNISSDSIILNSTNGTADAGDFLVLDGTDGSSSNANHRILFDDTFVDKIGLFNINTLGSAGQALKVNDAGNSFEFGAVEGGLVHIYGVTSSDVSTVDILSTANGGPLDFSKYKRYMVRIAGMKRHTGTSSEIPLMRVFNNNTIQTTSGHYKYAMHRIRANGANQGTGVSHTADSFNVVLSNYQSSTGMSSQAMLWIDFSPYYLHYYSDFVSYGNTTSNYIQSGQGGGVFMGATSNTVDGLRFFMSAGNLTGRIDIFGMLNTLGDEVG